MGSKYYLCDESGVQFGQCRYFPSVGQIIATEKGNMRVTDIKKANGFEVYYIYGTLI